MSGKQAIGNELTERDEEEDVDADRESCNNKYSVLQVWCHSLKCNITLINLMLAKVATSSCNTSCTGAICKALSHTPSSSSHPLHAALELLLQIVILTKPAHLLLNHCQSDLLRATPPTELKMQQIIIAGGRMGGRGTCIYHTRPTIDILKLIHSTSSSILNRFSSEARKIDMN